MAEKTSSLPPGEAAVKKKVKKPRRRRPLLLLLLILVIFMLIGGAVVFFLLDIELPFIEGKEEAAENSLPRYTYSMREFQVNLADQGTRRFLRTTVDLAYSERALTREIESRESELRSNIISILRSKEADDLAEPGGMRSLELELIARLNSLLETGDIEAIYYKEFIFQ